MCQAVAILGVNWTPFGNAYYITKECGGVPAPAGTDRDPRTQGFLGYWNLPAVQVAALLVPVGTTARCETATFSIADWEARWARFGDEINHNRWVSEVQTISDQYKRKHNNAGDILISSNFI